MWSRTLRTFLDVARIMLPVMILVRVAEELGFSNWLGTFLAPLMALLGLPGEVGIIWAIALVVGLYGGMGALLAMSPGLGLDVAQFNAVIVMILFAHAIPVEQAIVRRVGGPFWLTTGGRIFCAIVFAALLNGFAKATGFFSEPSSMGIMSVGPLETTWLQWAQSTLTTLCVIFAVLLLLLCMIDGFKKIGLFQWITDAMAPFFARLGIVPALAPLTTIGVLLGLTYGSGLIIEEAERNEFSKRDLLVPLFGLSILHAVVEDTVIVLAFGADFWIAVVARTAFAFIVLGCFAYVVEKRFPKAVAVSREAH